MVATYSKASSYDDRGTVTTVSSGSSSQTVKLAFETAFIRDRRFRFEYARIGRQALGSSRFVIWSDFTHTYTDWSLQPHIIDDGPNLGLAIEAAAGISSLSSIVIPKMLTRALGTFLGPRSPSIDGIETVAGHPCWRLRDKFRTADPVTLWVDRDSHLLRRLETSHRCPKFATVSTIDYEPEIDRPVDDGRLQSPDIAANSPIPRPPPSQMSSRQSPWLGIVFENSASTKIKTVIPGAPAERDGVQVGDEIVSLDGERVTLAREVYVRVVGHKMGDRIVLAVRRGGTTLEVPVTLEQRKSPRDMLVDQPAPAFDLPVLVGGGPAKLADLKGSVVVVDFWATWCGPCKVLVPHLNDLSHKFPALHIIGVSSEDDADIRRYAVDERVAYTLASDVDSRAFGAYFGSALPMLVVIDKTGVVREVELGAGGDTSALDGLIEKLLQAP
jgi:thiol-disulfide isomerase/thioredoxin